MRHHKSTCTIVYTCNNIIYRPGTLRDLAFAKSLINRAKSIFLLFFCGGGTLVVEAPGQLPIPPPPLNPALVVHVCYLSVRYHISQTTRRTFTKSSLHLVCGRGSVLHMATLQHVMYLCLCYVPCLLKMALYLTAAAVCGGFAAVGPADMIYRSNAARSAPHHRAAARRAAANARYVTFTADVGS